MNTWRGRKASRRGKVGAAGGGGNCTRLVKFEWRWGDLARKGKPGEDRNGRGKCWVNKERDEQPAGACCLSSNYAHFC
jgi:hypothetical protein